MSQSDCISSDAENNFENVHYISDKDLGFDVENYINNFEYETAGASENVNEIVDESLADNAEVNSNELVVLHPDHPLMKRFQDALQRMLKDHLSKAELELKEKSEDLKRSKTIHLELGSELYNAQQELSKFQGQLQKKREENIECQAKREKMDELLVTLRQQLKKTQEEYDIECKKMLKMREEVDNLALRLFYLNNAKLEVKSDISIMKRAAEKVTTELTKAEEVKLHQDMIAHRMQRTVDQLTEDVELLKEQVIAAEEELRSGEIVLKNMESQVMGIKSDRKRLMTHWTTSLIGLQRRNEAYAELMQDFQKKQDELTLVNVETEGIKKDITKEQEKHERLTLQLHRTQGDIVASQKELERLKTRHDEIRAEYAQTQRIIEETERNLENANMIQKDLDQEAKALQKKLSRELFKKHELEDQIDTLLRDKLSAAKSTAYTKRMATNVHDQSRELEVQAALLENALASDTLEVAKVKAETKVLDEQAKELENEIEKRNESLICLQQKIKQANLTVKRKQDQIDLLNQKLKRLLDNTGGIELGPLEITRNKLLKNMAAKQEEITSLEQQWLREQTELINKVKAKEELADDLSRQQVYLSVLNRKKLRLDSEINSIEKEKAQLSREVERLQNSMTRLNKCIYEQRSSSDAIEQENRFAEEDFILRIREKETQAVEAEAHLEEAVRDKEDLLADLLETERHILLWEKKVQLVNETRQAVDSASGLAELKAIRTEIHRMEVKKAQIARQQEQLIQALEHSVQKREFIMVRNECAKNTKSKETLTKHNLQREIEYLRGQIVSFEKSAKKFDDECLKLEAESRKLEGDLKSKCNDCEEIRKKSMGLTKELQDLAEYRQTNLIELQMRQHASRYWEQLLAGRYRRLCPSRQAAQNERDRQIGKMKSMLAVVDRLTMDFPEIKQDLSVVWQILSKRLAQEDDGRKSETN